MKFLGIILRVLRLEVSPIRCLHVHEGGGGGITIEVTMHSMAENSFVPIMSMNSASGVSSLKTGALASTRRANTKHGVGRNCLELFELAAAQHSSFSPCFIVKIVYNYGLRGQDTNCYECEHTLRCKFPCMGQSTVGPYFYALYLGIK